MLVSKRKLLIFITGLLITIGLPMEKSHAAYHSEQAEIIEDIIFDLYDYVDSSEVYNDKGNTYDSDCTKKAQGAMVIQFKIDSLTDLTNEIALEDLPSAYKALLDGKAVGRYLVRIYFRAFRSE